jgi:hypothetical protein
MVEQVPDELLGLGPLEPLLKEPSISDIMVNRFDKVYIERGGKLSETPVRFRDNRHLLHIIGKNRIAGPDAGSTKLSRLWTRGSWTGRGSTPLFLRSRSTARVSASAASAGM